MDLCWQSSGQEDEKNGDDGSQDEVTTVQPLSTEDQYASKEEEPCDDVCTGNRNSE